jgi:hypothetical protein
MDSFRLESSTGPQPLDSFFVFFIFFFFCFCFFGANLVLRLVCLLVRVLPVRVLIVFGVPRVVDIIFFLLLGVVGEAPRDWLVSLPRQLLVGRTFAQRMRRELRRSAQLAFMVKKKGTNTTDVGTEHAEEAGAPQGVGRGEAAPMPAHGPLLQKLLRTVDEAQHVEETIVVEHPERRGAGLLLSLDRGCSDPAPARALGKPTLLRSCSRHIFYLHTLHLIFRFRLLPFAHLRSPSL